MTQLSLLDLPPELLAQISTFIYTIDRITILQLIHPQFQHALQSQIHAALNLTEIPFRFQNWQDDDVHHIYKSFFVSHLFLQKMTDLDIVEEYEEKLMASVRCIEATIWSRAFYQRLKRIIKDFEHVTEWVLDFHVNQEDQVWDFLESIAQRTEELNMRMCSELDVLSFPKFERLRVLKLNAMQLRSLEPFPKLEYFRGSFHPECAIPPSTRDRLKEVVLHFNEFSRKSMQHFFSVLGDKLVEIVLLRIFVTEADAEFLFSLIQQSKLRKLNLIVSNLLVELPEKRLKEFVMPNVRAVQSHDQNFPNILLRVWHLFPNATSVQVNFSNMFKVDNWKIILIDRNKMLTEEGKHFGSELHDTILTQFQEMERCFRKYIEDPQNTRLSSTKIKRILDKSSILPVFHAYCYRRFWFERPAKSWGDE